MDGMSNKASRTGDGDKAAQVFFLLRQQVITRDLVPATPLLVPHLDACGSEGPGAYEYV
jgi:hypothetical protein